MNHQDPHHDLPDPALDALAARLDAVGDADMSAAQPGLEDRVLAGVGRVFAPEPVAFTPAAVPWWRTGAVRMAAGVALLVGAATVFYTVSRPTVTPQGGAGAVVSTAFVEQRIEGLLALASEPSDGFGDEIASIELWADALRTESDAAWIGSDLAETNWWDAGLSGGSGGAL
jgi:hypothetical protein